MCRVEQKAFFTFSHNINVVLQHDLMFDFPGTRPGFYDFSPLSHQNEDVGAYWASRLVQGHKKMGRQVIIEVGPHDRFSPFETAQAFPNTTILGIEPATIEWDEDKINGHIKEWNNSIVATFQFDVKKLKNRGLEVDRVQAVAPDPWSEMNILNTTAELICPGGQIIMAIDPFVVTTYYEDNDDQKPDKVAEQFANAHPGFEARVRYMTIEEIKKTYGFSDSKYLKREGLLDIPVIVATRKLIPLQQN